MSKGDWKKAQEYALDIAARKDAVRGGIEFSVGLMFPEYMTELFPVEYEEVPYTVLPGAPISTSSGDWPNSLYSFTSAKNSHVDWIYVGKSSRIKVIGGTIATGLVFRDSSWRIVANVTPNATGIVAIPKGAAWVSRTFAYSGGEESSKLKFYLPRRIISQDWVADAYRTAALLARRDSLFVSPNAFFSLGTQYERIVAALDFIRKAGAGTLHLATDTILGSSVWTISRPLILPSNTAIYIDNATLKLANGVFDNILRSDSITFDPDNPYSVIKHLGQTENIHIYGSGIGTAFVEGPDTPYTAPHPISGGASVPWVSDKYGWRTIGILWANVKNYSVHDFTIRKCSAWAISNEHGCDNFIIEGIAANSTNLNGDGVDVRKGCSNGIVRRITGTTQDDTVALTAITNFITAYPSGAYIWPMQVLGDAPQPVYGDDIRNVTVSDVQSSSTGSQQVRVLAAGGSKIDRVAVDNVVSTGTIGGGKQVWIHTGVYGALAALGDMTNISVSKVRCNHASTPVTLDAPLQNCHVNDIEKLTALGGSLSATGGYYAGSENTFVTNGRFV